jgi:hypothetical protein
MPASGLVAGRPPNVRHFAPRATASASKLMGLVTLWDGSENHECALPLWCQQAHRLAAKIPPPWRTQLVVMAPKSSAECNASYVWSNDTARANRAYLDRTPIKGSWSYLKHCTLLKWGVFALSHLDLVLYADVDVDLDPTRFQFHRALLRPEGDPTRFQLHETFVALFRASIGAFLLDLLGLANPNPYPNPSPDPDPDPNPNPNPNPSQTPSYSRALSSSASLTTRARSTRVALTLTLTYPYPYP